MKASKKRQREQKELGQGKKSLKEVELSWGIGEHDLERKMKQVTEFLQRGMKVGVILAKKKGSGKKDESSYEQDESLLEKIRALISNTPGTWESKTPVGRIGRTLTLFFEGHVLQATGPQVADKRVKPMTKEEQRLQRKENKKERRLENKERRLLEMEEKEKEKMEKLERKRMKKQRKKKTENDDDDDDDYDVDEDEEDEDEEEENKN